MGSFSVESFEKKLKDLNVSQQSIQTLSQWVVHHRKHSKAIVEAWHREVVNSKEGKKLTLVYLANDIIQNSKRKGAEFAAAFARVLPMALENVCKLCDETIEKAANHVLDIWQKRGIYSAEEIAAFRPRSFTPPFTPPNPTPAKKAKVIEEVVEYEELEEKDDDELLESADIKTLLERLNDLEECPSNDSATRLEIGNLPEEVFSVEKATDYPDQEKIKREVSHAESLLSRYSQKLEIEVKDRAEVIQMIRALMKQHKAELTKSEERLEQHKLKMAQMEGVRKQLQSHLDSLPDLSRLQGSSTGLAPLPSVGDLFS